jgi:exodeoxyribonuclease VII large subunit
VVDLDARDEIDVIILARGGGDATELLPFSDEDVCRAVAACTTPTVSAIGHDGDRPLLDEVADHRCGTPSIAAALVIPAEAELRNELDYWLHRVTETAFAQLARAEARLDGEAPGRALRAGLDVAALRLERALNRLDGAHPRALVKAADAQLLGFTATLEALDPVRVLERGYAVVRDAAGAVLRDTSHLSRGDAVRVTVAMGAFTADFTEIET